MSITKLYKLIVKCCGEIKELESNPNLRLAKRSIKQCEIRYAIVYLFTSITNVTSNSLKNRQIIGSTEVIEYIMDLLNNYSDHNDVVESGLAVIANLCSHCNENKDRFNQFNTNQYVIDQTNKHINDEMKIMEQGVRAISSLSANNSTNAEELGKHGVCALLVDVLSVSHYSNQLHITQFALSAIANLCSSYPENVNEFAKTTICSIVLLVLHKSFGNDDEFLVENPMFSHIYNSYEVKHQSKRIMNKKIQHNSQIENLNTSVLALMAISSLSVKCLPNKMSFVEAGICQVLANVLTTKIVKSDMIISICSTIANLTANCNISKQKFIELKTDMLLLELLSNSSESLAPHIEKALTNLCANYSGKLNSKSHKKVLEGLGIKSNSSQSTSNPVTSWFRKSANVFNIV
mmetsp:Transcript_20020/g.18176  ORF Transcript_20020/g.18176 Transcript_20020/m.18176 type:complete len:406 (+) Transcript_20020:754-1971(+)